MFLGAKGDTGPPGPQGPVAAIENQPETVLPTVVPLVISTSTPQPTATPVPRPTAPPVPVGSQSNPVLMGVTGQVLSAGDRKWEITVTDIVPDAWGLVQAENRFNDPPAPGTQFYMVSLRVKNTGSQKRHFLPSNLRSVGTSVGVGLHDPLRIHVESFPERTTRNCSRPSRWRPIYAGRLHWRTWTA